MSEPTPGPWHPTADGRYVRKQDHPGKWPDWNICEVNQNAAMDYGETARANARLIAAAPDMAEALRPFAYLAEVMEEGQMLNFRGVYVSYEQAQAAAAALAKAEGCDA